MRGKYFFNENNTLFLTYVIDKIFCDAVVLLANNIEIGKQ